MKIFQADEQNLFFLQNFILNSLISGSRILHSSAPLIQKYLDIIMYWCRQIVINLNYVQIKVIKSFIRKLIANFYKPEKLNHEFRRH